MPCPCCLSVPVSAPVPPGKPGDLFCADCEWLFAAELLDGQDPFMLADVLRCPKHERELGNQRRW